jgi:hypothetical protein
MTDFFSKKLEIILEKLLQKYEYWRGIDKSGCNGYNNKGIHHGTDDCQIGVYQPSGCKREEKSKNKKATFGF